MDLSKISTDDLLEELLTRDDSNIHEVDLYPNMIMVDIKMDIQRK